MRLLLAYSWTVVFVIFMSTSRPWFIFLMLRRIRMICVWTVCAWCLTILGSVIIVFGVLVGWWVVGSMVRVLMVIWPESGRGCKWGSLPVLVWTLCRWCGRCWWCGTWSWRGCWVRSESGWDSTYQCVLSCNCQVFCHRDWGTYCVRIFNRSQSWGVWPWRGSFVCELLIKGHRCRHRLSLGRGSRRERSRWFGRGCGFWCGCFRSRFRFVTFCFSWLQAGDSPWWRQVDRGGTFGSWIVWCWSINFPSSNAAQYKRRVWQTLTLWARQISPQHWGSW